jgi:hypothetical protein
MLFHNNLKLFYTTNIGESFHSFFSVLIDNPYNADTHFYAPQVKMAT